MYTDLPTAGKPEQSARLPDSKRPANDEQQARESEKAFEEALTRTPP
jgi:hypothetical protein